MTVKSSVSLPRGAVGWSVFFIVLFPGHTDSGHCSIKNQSEKLVKCNFHVLASDSHARSSSTVALYAF